MEKENRLILGCMRISKLTVNEVEKLIYKALELGIIFFDHADIYGKGMCESLFGEVLKNNPNLRDKIIIQSKCGIRSGYYDFSKEHILTSVNESLKRLNTDYLDILLLHRPDALLDVNEVREAFNILYQEGKVRKFGVSNMNPSQIEYLQAHLDYKILYNQLQFSIVHSAMLDAYFNVNMTNDLAVNRDGGLLEYSMLKGITIQAWSPLQASWEEGSFINHPKYELLNQKLEELAIKYQVTPSAIAISWILRHPAKIYPVIGTTNIKHLEEISEATKIYLTKPEWYELYSAVKGRLP